MATEILFKPYLFSGLDKPGCAEMVFNAIMVNQNFTLEITYRFKRKILQ